MADSFITNVVHTYHDNDSDTLYGVVRNPTKQIRDVVNSEWDSHPASGSLDDYDISAGIASGGLWSGSFPQIAAGFYIYQIRKRAGATPDCSDQIIAAEKGYWNGSCFVYSSENLDKAAKVLVNKAIQTKSTGVVVIYDDDGVTPILTHTPTDSESTITRTPS